MSEHFAIILKMVSLLWADMKVKTAYHIVSVILVSIFYKALSSYNLFYKYIPWLTGLSVFIILSFIAVTIWQAHKLESNAVEKEIFLQNQVPIAYGVVVFFVFCLMLNILKLHSGDPNQKHNEIVAGQSEISDQVNSIGLSLNEYVRKTEERLAKIDDDIEKTQNSEEKNNLLRQKFALEEKLLNTEKSYKEQVEHLENQIKQLKEKGKDFPPDLLEGALKALSEGDEDKAIELFQSVYSSAEPHIKAAAEALYQEGKIAYLRSDYRLALNRFERAVELVPDNSEYIFHAGIINSNMYHFKRATGFLEKALDAQIDEYGIDSDKVITTRQHLGNAYFNDDRNQDGFEQVELAYKSNVKLYGEKSDKARSSLHNLAMSYFNLKDYTTALRLEKGLLEDIEKDIEQDIENDNLEGRRILGTIKNSIGLCYIFLNDYPKAIKYIKDALKDEIKFFGENHPEVTAIRSTLANVYLDVGKVKKAEEQLELAIDADLITYGENHPQVTSNKRKLKALQAKE